MYHTILRALGLVWKADQKHSIYLVITQVLLAFLPIVSLYLMKELIDSIELLSQSSKEIRAAIYILVIYILVEIVTVLVTNINGYMNEAYQQKVQDYISRLMIQKSANINYSYYESNEYYNTLHLAQREAAFRPSQMVGSLNSLFSCILLLGSLGVLFLTLHWLISVIFLFLFVPLALVKYYYTKRIHQLKVRTSELERKSHYYNQLLSHKDYAKEVRIFNLGTYFTNLFKNLRKELYHLKINLSYKQYQSVFLVQIIEKLVLVGILIYIIYQSSNGLLSIGAVVMYLTAAQKSQSTMKGLIQSLISIFNHRLFISHLFEFLDLEEEDIRSEGITGQITTSPIIESITFQQVGFVYPDSRKYVLKGIQTTWKKGQVIAIVGENGSGKTTLIKILSRLFDPTDGQILINEHTDLTHIDKATWRKKITVIFQDYVKYHLSIAENVSVSDINKSNKEDVNDALLLADAKEIAESYEQGINQNLGKNFRSGTQLSVGQWQRLALARTFYKDSEIIILDEPSSAIDPLAESRIFSNLRDMARDKILILITHRLYNLQIADLIITMDNGAIAEEGTFEELKNNKGLFYSMFEKQIAKEEAG